MSKQTKPIDLTCAKPNCQRQATIGVFGWAWTETDVKLNHPLGAYCGPHKLDFGNGYAKGLNLRNVRFDLSI